MRKYDLDRFYPSQAAYLGVSPDTLHRRVTGTNNVEIRSGALRHDLALKFYQLYNDTKIMSDPRIRYFPKRAFPVLCDGSRVSYGYVLESCDAWMECARIKNTRKDARDRTTTSA